MSAPVPEERRQRQHLMEVQPRAGVQGNEAEPSTQCRWKAAWSRLPRSVWEVPQPAEEPWPAAWSQSPHHGALLAALVSAVTVTSAFWVRRPHGFRPTSPRSCIKEQLGDRAQCVRPARGRRKAGSDTVTTATHHPAVMHVSVEQLLLWGEFSSAPGPPSQQRPSVGITVGQADTNQPWPHRPPAPRFTACCTPGGI